MKLSGSGVVVILALYNVEEYCRNNETVMNTTCSTEELCKCNETVKMSTTSRSTEEPCSCEASSGAAMIVFIVLFLIALGWIILSHILFCILIYRYIYIIMHACMHVLHASVEMLV